MRRDNRPEIPDHELIKVRGVILLRALFLSHHRRLDFVAEAYPYKMYDYAWSMAV